MKIKFTPLLLTFLCLSSFLTAQDKIYIQKKDKNVWGLYPAAIDSIFFDLKGETTYLAFPGDEVLSMESQEIEYLTFGEDSKVISITYDGSTAYCTNPMWRNGVDIAVDGADVIVTATTDEELEYHLTGSTTDGMFKIYSEKKFTILLNGVNIHNEDGPAINVQSSKKITVLSADGTTNTLTDGATYAKVSGEDQKGTFFSEGQLIFEGTGTLEVTGANKHAICSDDYLRINSGNIIIHGAASDGIHANDYVRIDGGNINITSSSDGIDAGEGYFLMNGGYVQIQSIENDVKGIKCDDIFTLNDGEISMTVKGDQSKGLKSKKALTINGGKFTAVLSGKALIVDNDPSYCTAIKSDADILINGGDIQITHSGLAGKGISADGNLEVRNAQINISTSGDGSTYTTASNVKDSYSSTCITVDGDIFIQSGTLTLSCSGTAGKGISGEAMLTFGDAENVPYLNVSTTGKKFLVSGSGMNADYANPKAIKCDGDMFVNNGNFVIRTTQDGGEGLESKSVLTINDGVLDINTYDDGINASNAIIINGGKIYVYSSGNDGIDSNGTLTVTGGIVIASGTSAPEEGFDCDQNTFRITGGILIGTGGATSTPTASVCTQNTVIYGTSGSADQLFHIADSEGNDILSYKIPRNYNQLTLFFSSPDLQKNTTYTIYKGGIVSGAEEFHGYYTGGTYSGGTQATTFTPTSTVTQIGTTGGGGGGRP